MPHSKEIESLLSRIILEKWDRSVERDRVAFARRLQRALRRAWGTKLETSEILSVAPVQDTLLTSRYMVSGKNQGPVIISKFINPHDGIQYNADETFLEDFEEPLDEILLDHLLRDLVHSYAVSQAADHVRTDAIPPKRILSMDNNLSKSEILTMLRHSKLKEILKIIAFHEVDVQRLRAFLETKRGQQRLAEAIRHGSPKYRERIAELLAQ